MDEQSSPDRRYVASKEWRLAYENGFLIISAGADELFAIEDVGADTGAELVAAWQSEAIACAALSAGAGELLVQLVAAGVVVPELASGPSRKVALRHSGDRCADLELALLERLDASERLDAVELELSDLVVFVRTNGRLGGIYDGTPAWRERPHLLLDTAYHHTISLGPLVFAGDTACVGCLAGRIGHYWGDAPPPARPAVQTHATLVAALLALELEKIAAGDFGLVGATVSWDLRGWEIKRSAVYKLPWCPLCGEPEPAELLGSIDLPWTSAA